MTRRPRPSIPGGDRPELPAWLPPVPPLGPVVHRPYTGRTAGGHHAACHCGWKVYTTSGVEAQAAATAHADRNPATDDK